MSMSDLGGVRIPVKALQFNRKQERPGHSFFKLPLSAVPIDRNQMRQTRLDGPSLNNSKVVIRFLDRGYYHRGLLLLYNFGKLLRRLS